MTRPPPRLISRDAHVGEPGLAPGLNRPVRPGTAVMTGDVRPEEPAHDEPLAAAGQQAAERQQRPGVQPPGRAPERRGRNAELQARHPAARPDHASELGQRRLRIIDVAQQVGEGQRVEAGVREGKLLGPASDQADPVGQPGLGHVDPAAGAASARSGRRRRTRPWYGEPAGSRRPAVPDATSRTVLPGA